MQLSRMAGVVGAAIVLCGVSGGAQDAGTPKPVEIPASATTLKGIPSVRVESTQEGTTRRVLDPAEAAKEALTIKIVDGEFYWTSRGKEPLRLFSSGEFTYLSSTDPGRYIRFTRLNNSISYIEHVDTTFGSVAWWGTLRIEVGQ
jgi:hypothetical protein